MKREIPKSSGVSVSSITWSSITRANWAFLGLTVILFTSTAVDTIVVGVWLSIKHGIWLAGVQLLGAVFLYYLSEFKGNARRRINWVVTVAAVGLTVGFFVRGLILATPLLGVIWLTTATISWKLIANLKRELINEKNRGIGSWLPPIKLLPTRIDTNNSSQNDQLRTLLDADVHLLLADSTIVSKRSVQRILKKIGIVLLTLTLVSGWFVIASRT